MGVITESERAKWFAYYDGVADGLNESRNNVNSVLDKIRAEMHATAKMHANGYYYLHEEWIDEIIDKYKAEVDPQGSEK